MMNSNIEDEISRVWDEYMQHHKVFQEYPLSYRCELSNYIDSYTAQLSDLKRNYAERAAITWKIFSRKADLEKISSEIESLSKRIDSLRQEKQRIDAAQEKSLKAEQKLIDSLKFRISQSIPNSNANLEQHCLSALERAKSEWNKCLQVEQWNFLHRIRKSLDEGKGIMDENRKKKSFVEPEISLNRNHHWLRSALDEGEVWMRRIMGCFPSLELEEGWIPTYVIRGRFSEVPTNVQLKPFLTDGKGTVCTNLFQHIRIRENSPLAAMDAALFAHMLYAMSWHSEIDPAVIFGLQHFFSAFSSLKKSELIAFFRSCFLRIENVSKNSFRIRYLVCEGPPDATPGWNDRIDKYYENCVVVPVGGIIGTLPIQRTFLAKIDYGPIHWEMTRFPPPWRFSEL